MFMELDRILIPVILTVVGMLVFNSMSSSSSFLMFSVVNTIIFTIRVGSRQPPSTEVDKVFVVFLSILEEGIETQEGILEYATVDEVNESGDGYCKSLSYTKDEGVDNVDEISQIKRQEEESDDNLKTRIESFIAKVYQGWMEESRWDKYSSGLDI
ncbi:hypothetical protein RIF29_34174 [Crotalaria pallida]|uniref:Uncharacterized protein n=1 Tax=Crotalaria pallida TaxID=3830 RepID=A0AAN9HT87_CROPI